MKKILIAALLSASVLVLAPACKKKNEGGQPADKTEAAKPAAGGDMKAPEAPKAAAGGGAIANAADYEAKATDLMTKLTAVFAADGTDCDKLAGDISKFMDDYKATFDGVM